MAGRRSKSRKPRRGYFVTFEGGEGSGKTTQIRRLAAKLRALGHPVTVTREPGSGPLGPVFRRLLLASTPLPNRCELFLFLADRAQHVETVVRPALARGRVVLCDRFEDSTTAYQGGGRGYPSALLSAANRAASGGLRPDRTFLLDVPPEVGIRRLSGRGESKDGLEREDIAFHRRVRAAYLALARREPRRVVKLDGTKEPAAVFEALWRRLPAWLRSPASSLPLKSRR